MRVVEFRHEAELLRIRPEWDALLSQSASGTIFSSWEWVTAWWSSYGAPGELRILLAFDDEGALRGIAPLRAQVLRRYGQSVPSLCFVGDGSNDSDYLDFIFASKYEEAAIEAFRRHWSRDLKRGVVLQLNELPGTSPSLPLLRKMAQEERLLITDTDIACGTVRLPATWEEYTGRLRPRFRTKLRSVLHQLESRSEIRFGFSDTQEQIERVLRALFDLHTRRWVKDGRPGVFGWDRKRAFYVALSPLLLECSRLRLSWLEWNGRLLACQYGFVYRDTYFQLQEGYEPAAEHLNVGIGLRAWSIRELLRQGVREYDFLAGVGRHKADWGAETKHSKQLLIAAASLTNRLVSSGPQWEDRAKTAVKNALPASWLAARQADVAARRTAPPESRWDCLRRAAAHCVLRLGVPKLVRPLRDRYQLTITANGTSRKFGCQRRVQTAARVLCYHRVNDDGDALFPAISTKLFDREMRWLAGHFTVVRLSELLDRLQAGPAEPVLAITFDDGYGDNYSNAFPILQRYGLPATIFLTTGGIDSREPLWFEQLADGLKRTELDHLDLEVGFPRRFRLRTGEERLQANAGIFSLLRGMPDRERRRNMSDILRQLRAPHHDGCRDKMLTWDEVRLMKAGGIDFGGHTVTHPFLSRLTHDELVSEVSTCKRRIEEELQCPAEYFAYPHGREEDFAPSDAAVLRSAGYRAAFTTIWGINDRSTDPMTLRRGGPWEDDAALFACKLDWYSWVNG